MKTRVEFDAKCTGLHLVPEIRAGGLVLTVCVPVHGRCEGRHGHGGAFHRLRVFQEFLRVSASGASASVRKVATSVPVAI